MSESKDKESISELPSRIASQLCRLAGSEDAQLKEAFKVSIQKAMSDAIASSKQDLLRAAFDSGFATSSFIELVDEAIPTFGENGAELSSNMFRPQ